MIHESFGLHHFHQRKRIDEKQESYSHTSKLQRLMDNCIYFIGIVGIFMTLPQVYNVWVLRNAAGVSAISWAWYGVAGLFWLIYGIVHREKAIILTNLAWMILDSLIVIGVIIY